MSGGSTVLVTDGEQRAALAAVRALGAAGYRVVVLAESGRSLAGASRHAARTVAAPSPLREPGAFADAVARLAREERAALVIPIAEPAMLALLPARERLAPAVIPFPDLHAFRALSDKQRLLEEAREVGIAIPAQVVVRDAAEAATLAADHLRYPLVLKPARSVGGEGSAREKTAVTYAADAADLRAKLAAMRPAAFPVLLQQRIVGPGTGIFLLLWEGRELARFAHRRLREKPPSGGVSVYRESIAIDQDLLDRSRALLNRFGWHGPAMVEFKREAATGVPYLMEVNGRFWGSLQLAIDAGVDFPTLLAQAALGGTPSPVTDYRVGVRSSWWWGQVDHLVARARRRRDALLPPDVPTPGSAVRDLLFGPLRQLDREEVLRWSDPRPFLHESLQWLRLR